MSFSITVWRGFRRLLGQQLAFLPTKNRSPLEILILATLGCILAAALKYPNRAFLTTARPDLKERKVDTPQLPLLGNLVQMIRNRHQQLHLFHQMFLEHGDFMSMTIPGVGRIHWVNNPRFMEHILKTNFDNYVKGDFFRRQLADILGNGIFVSDGAEWRFHRKTAANIFATRLYRDLVQGAFKSSAHDLCSVLDRRHFGEA
ncbi:cytochrome P450-dit2, partial [Podila minutissima]